MDAPTKLTRGTIREDGYVFWAYHRSYENRERWVSAVEYVKLKELGKLNNRSHYARHRKKLLLQTRVWKSKNAKHVNAYRNRRTKERKHNDPAYAIKLTLRSRVNKAIRRGTTTGVKSASTELLTGCSTPELINFLESKFQPGMTWQNHGIRGWHIDHIKPVAAFRLADPAQQRECFHYTNLQPLWAKDNLAKGDKYL